VAANTLKLVRAILAGQTAAGSRVGVALAGSPTFPAITYDLAGGARNAVEVQRAEPRVRVSTWGPNSVAGDAMAYELALEVESVLIPQTSPVMGFHGNVTIDGVPVYVYDVMEEVGPTFLDDPSGYARYDTLYRFSHY
jgi:hypothetical protein